MLVCGVWKQYVVKSVRIYWALDLHFWAHISHSVLPIVLLQISKHNNHFHILFVDHSPKILNGMFKGSLSANPFLAVFITHDVIGVNVIILTGWNGFGICKRKEEKKVY